MCTHTHLLSGEAGPELCTSRVLRASSSKKYKDFPATSPQLASPHKMDDDSTPAGMGGASLVITGRCGLSIGWCVSMCVCV